MKDKVKLLLEMVATLNDLSLAGADTDSYMDEIITQIETDETLSPLFNEIKGE